MPDDKRPVGQPEAAGLLSRVKPVFWDSKATDRGPFRRLFDFQKIWKQAVLLMICVALVPLLSLAYFDYRVTRSYTENEIVLRTEQLMTNTRRTVAFFLEERQAALQFLVHSHSLAELDEERHLAHILESLKATIGGFTDIGLVDASGRHFRYIGPYALLDKNYAGEAWFRDVVESGVHISDVYLGFRGEPHLVIAVRQDLPGGSFYILRATLNTAWFNSQLAQVKESGFGDSFLINRQGIIQTPTAHYGEVLERVRLPDLPPYSERVQVVESPDREGRVLVIGSAGIPASPYILMIVRPKQEFMRPWLQTRLVVVTFIVASMVLIMLVIVGVATRLVNELYYADRERIRAMREAEQAGKLASVGRLAAGVAHEINNPLAIINEKAGLMQDVLSRGDLATQAARLPVLLDSILASVGRCAAITRRLLGFARHLEVSWQPVRLREVVGEVLEFNQKEAEYRNIHIDVGISDDIPVFTSDRGKLQQIFLNLVNNAFAAIGDGGNLHITGTMKDPEHVLVTVTDDGHGIPESDMKRIFEPFFSTKTQKGGTGLGLSITYGLVRELGGTIRVESALGVGTRFFILLPLTANHNKQNGRD